MKDLHPGFAIAAWPRPSHTTAVANETERWLAAVTELADKTAAGFARRLAKAAAGRALLGAVFGNSPYLSELLLADPAFTVDLLRRGPDIAFVDAIADLRTRFGGPTDLAALMTGLRVGKRRTALSIALADIAGLWPLTKVTGALCDMAETALDLGVRHLLREAAAAGALRLADLERPEHRSGLSVIGMGKLGGRELNYSSDIDIIVLYDDETIATDAPDSLQKACVRLTRGLVKIMDERTPEGYVFRTDLRLRPDPGATPIAMSMIAAETYYESLGQNWERMAMIKARPVAGDKEAGARFLARLRPYVWRKNLDFAAIQDIHSVKRQIQAHHGGAKVALGGHNIKVGRGGIREIEFFAQTLQLIWGGRDPELRSASTCPALTALAAAKHTDSKTVADLIVIYEFLRRVEHRLQMIDDRQTQVLPEPGPDFERLAIFLGFADGKAFGEAMLERLYRVEKLYARLFEEAPTLSGPGNLVFTGTDDDPGTIKTLTTLGFVEPSKIAAAIRGWHHGRCRAMRSTRARELLTELTPTLLLALSKTAQPDAAFLKFDEFLNRLPAGVQLFSLFHANPGLLDLVAEIMGGAPRLADTLSIHPRLLDFVLSGGFFNPPRDRERLSQELGRALDQARDFEDILELSRRWKSEREFQIGVQLLRGVTAPAKAGQSLADIAEVVIAAMQPAVETEFARQHGRIPGGELGIVALGKLGGREMTVTSDLDLVFLYDVPAGTEASRGAKPLPVSLYYTRLANRLIQSLSALTGEGRLYEIDMRLRPSGNKGPIAAHVDGFAAYFQESAWTWEYLALTRARPLTGSARLRARVAAIVHEALTRPRDPLKLAGEVAAMRALMAREHRAPSPWDIKHWRGGLIDIEFIAQYLQLRFAPTHPEMLATNTATALERAEQRGLLAPRDGRVLREALHLWQAIQGMLRLCTEGQFDPAGAAPGLRQAIARAAVAGDFAELEAEIRAKAAAVHGIFERLLPAAADQPRNAAAP
ncbi:MAG: bifunctional [glutamine synthetase] adenylyltransferase/[glutamine synthetase]-adenylyl-L-tyrosine phosphorylase [Proteobacteria bacterium]|nr:bifunctional [glutamine synthetase] adenylyltransferase/[glutamine synthetase]-adenylyl-L-tyrosine phosphorylase [Pseudomonadota bacterium]